MSQAANSIIYRIMNTFSNACVQREPKQAQRTNPLPISITVNLPFGLSIRVQAAQVVVYSKPSHDNGENGDYGQQVETPSCFTFQQRNKTDMKYQCVDNNRD